MELYRVTSVVNDFVHNHRRYDDVKVHWFGNRKFPVIAYRKVVKDFDTLSEKDRFFAKESVKELLTTREAEQLKQYLHAVHKWTVDVSPYPLPVERGYLGFRAHEVGGTIGFIKLNEEKNFNLPVQVWGYYDVEGIEPVGGLVNTISEFITRVRKRVSGLVNRPLPRDKGTV
jgi:hypothetical protein